MVVYPARANDVRLLAVMWRYASTRLAMSCSTSRAPDVLSDAVDVQADSESEGKRQVCYIMLEYSFIIQSYFVHESPVLWEMNYGHGIIVAIVIVVVVS